MSGLLVKSTVIMKDNLEEMTRAGLTMPVLLGGAALTRAYVEEDCVKAYGSGRVAYAGDAFDGLSLMDKVAGGAFDDYAAALQARRAGRPGNRKRVLGEATSAATGPVDLAATRARRTRLGAGVAVPAAPFWGARVLDKMPLKNIAPYLNERMLYQLQWGYRKDGRTLDQFREWAKGALRPILMRLLETCAKEEILQPRAVYGYWPAAAEGNDLILFAEDGITEQARFTLPRQARADGECIADFVRDVSEGERDVVGLQLVTMGAHATDVAMDWFTANRYQDYLYLHGLSVEMTEALAEYVHLRIRAELGIGAEDARDTDALLQQGYRGSRYSFGYPACPGWKTRSRCCACSGPSASASPCPMTGSFIPSKAPAPSCCTTPRRGIFRSERRTPGPVPPTGKGRVGRPTPPFDLLTKSKILAGLRQIVPSEPAALCALTVAGRVGDADNRLAVGATVL
jgi:5-methyltetrahydrofolate--homocysteine methyltransferase